tara:strand:+ start:411 stop:569 length:159 start_codon:yes stop_codon:yes gene_type:complete
MPTFAESSVPVDNIKAVSLEQMEIARLEAALVRVRMESHILKNSGRFARKSR